MIAMDTDTGIEMNQFATTTFDSVVPLSKALQDTENDIRALDTRSKIIMALFDARVADAIKIKDRSIHSGDLLSSKENVDRALQGIRQRIHQRVVGSFEMLMSSVVTDCIKFSGRGIVIDTFVQRGESAMEILAINEDGFQNSVYEGSGGGLTNAVCAALRLIALFRCQSGPSPLRPFLFLDEPDCWFETGEVERFYDTILPVAEQLGVQMVIVTHHPDSVMGSHPRLVQHIERDGDEVFITGDIPDDLWAPGQIGLRSIRLRHFRNHRDSTLFLAPGTTVLNGKMNVGKSRFSEALRAMSTSAGDDHQIQWGSSEAQVIVETEYGVMEWFRRRECKKGQTKETYQFSAIDGQVWLDPGTAGTPAWMEDRKIWGIRSVKGMDIQVSNQKKPVFLIDLPPRQQSEILSIGNEAERLDKMVAHWKSKIRDARSMFSSAVKDLDGIADTIKNFINSSKNIDNNAGNGYAATLMDISVDTDNGDLHILENVKKLWAMNALVDKYESVKNLFNSYCQLESLIAEIEKCKITDIIDLPNNRDKHNVNNTLEMLSDVCILQENIDGMQKIDNSLLFKDDKQESIDIIHESISKAKSSMDDIVTLRKLYGDLILSKKKASIVAPMDQRFLNLGDNITQAAAVTKFIQSAVVDMVDLSKIIKKEKLLKQEPYDFSVIQSAISLCGEHISTFISDVAGFEILENMNSRHHESVILEKNISECGDQIKMLKSHFAEDCPLCGSHIEPGLMHGH